jgi:uncharacterized NAD-dependent epimerase/dehydratase family protein
MTFGIRTAGSLSARARAARAAVCSPWSLFHPAYAGVTLGLLHGSQPDALVLCHDPTRKALHGFPHFPVITLEQALAGYLSMARLTNRNVRFVGVALNTSALNEAEAAKVLARTAESLRLPCVDPIRTGVAPIVSALEAFEAPSHSS